MFCVFCVFVHYRTLINVFNGKPKLYHRELSIAEFNATPENYLQVNCVYEACMICHMSCCVHRSISTSSKAFSMVLLMDSRHKLSFSEQCCWVAFGHGSTIKNRVDARSRYFMGRWAGKPHQHHSSQYSTVIYGCMGSIWIPAFSWASV